MTNINALFTTGSEMMPMQLARLHTTPIYTVGFVTVNFKELSHECLDNSIYYTGVHNWAKKWLQQVDNVYLMLPRHVCIIGAGIGSKMTDTNTKFRYKQCQGILSTQVPAT